MATSWRKSTLSILNGQTDSPILDLTEAKARYGVHLTIIAPGTLPEAITVQVTDGAAGTIFGTLQSSGADITIAAAKAVVIGKLVAGGLRLHAGVAVAAQRDFIIQGAPTS
jgi:filamentous hemagglutinin family protein